MHKIRCYTDEKKPIDPVAPTSHFPADDVDAASCLRLRANRPIHLKHSLSPGLRPFWQAESGRGASRADPCYAARPKHHV